MAIEPKYERLVSSERKKLGVTQSVIECCLPANDSNEIKKVMCANAKSFILNSEAQNGEVVFNGNVNFQVIYENENGEFNGLDYTADFKDKFLNDEINMLSTPVVTSSVVDVNTSISGQDVKVVAIVEITVEIIKNTENNSLMLVSGDNVYYNTDTIKVSNFIGVLLSKFENGYDIEIKDNVLKVLEVTCSPYIETVIPQEKFAKVVGGANIDICYVSSGETNMLRTHQTKVTFTEEVALEQLTEKSCVQSYLNINNSLIKITTNIDVDYAVVNLNLPYEYAGYAFNEREVEVVNDIFSTENFLRVNTESFNTVKCGGKLNLESKVSGSVESDDKSYDEVLGTCCNTVTIATSFIEMGNLILEGVASTTVLYFNKETNSTYSTVVEMPFSLSEPANDLTENFMPVVNVSLGEITAKIKRGRDLEVSATLFVYTDFYSVNPEAVITDISVLEDKPECEAVLTIYVVKTGETIWDIAKQLNVNPDSLLEQNPQVLLPLVGGEKFIVYRQREMQF